VHATRTPATAWQDNTLVGFERSLYKGIHTLRGALGDSAIAPRYIETITGRGYRFIPIPQEPSKPRGRRRNGREVGLVAVLPLASESADAEVDLLNRIIIKRVIDLCRGHLEYGCWLTRLFSISRGGT
jgi:hypothetical protein